MTGTRGAAFSVGFWAALGVAACALLLVSVGRFLEALLSVATPFLVSVVFTLMLDPLVDRIQRRRLARGRRLPAVLAVYVLFLLVFAALVALVVPRLVAQAQLLSLRLPDHFDQAREALNAWLASHRRIGPVELPRSTNALLAQYSDQAATVLKASLGRVAALIFGSVSGLLSVVLIPIITFYLLCDIDRLRARLLFLLPDRYRRAFTPVALEVGGVFGDYVRGLLLVCSAYAVAAGILLLILGLKAYALLLGVAAGVLYAVPYIGAFVTLLLSATVALAAGKGVGYVILVVAALVILNQVFDNVVTPRVVGGGVGLHPVISLLALLLGGQLLGLWGMLLAVPVAASVQVVLFRLFPRLAAPTPPRFLRVTGAEIDEPPDDPGPVELGEEPPPAPFTAAPNP